MLNDRPQLLLTILEQLPLQQTPCWTGWWHQWQGCGLRNDLLRKACACAVPSFCNNNMYMLSICLYVDFILQLCLVFVHFFGSWVYTYFTLFTLAIYKSFSLYLSCFRFFFCIIEQSLSVFVCRYAELAFNFYQTLPMWFPYLNYFLWYISFYKI